MCSLHYPICLECVCLYKLESKLSKPQWRREQLIFTYCAAATTQVDIVVIDLPVVEGRTVGL